MGSNNGQTHSLSSRQVMWCVAVIRHAAIRARRQRRRWQRDLLLLNETDERGEEFIVNLVDNKSVIPFHYTDIKEMLNVLPTLQRSIIYELFWLDKTQQEVGRLHGISQQKVARLKQMALARLRQEMEKWITGD